MTCFFAIVWLYLWISFWYLEYILALLPQTEFLFGRWYLCPTASSMAWATSLLYRKLHSPAQPNITTAKRLEVQFVSPRIAYADKLE
jgi:hypothetical protein